MKAEKLNTNISKNVLNIEEETNNIINFMFE